MEPWLCEQQLKRLEQHRYSSAGRSVLEPVMQPFWCWLVGRCPLWVAPNLITIIGLIVNITTTLILAYYCPTATEQAPCWVYVACAVGLFIYQSLDAIDGKQARRTNSSTPLGELFDHGCDSLSTVFVVLGTCMAVQMGTDPDLMFFCCFGGMFMFYSAHWQTYVSGTLHFGIIDVTEVQMFIITVYLLAAIGGNALWQYMVPVLNIQMKVIPSVFTLFAIIFSSSNYLRVIFKENRSKKGSTIAGASLLSPAFHITLLLTLALLTYKISTQKLFEQSPCLFVVAFGFSSAKITNRLVVAHMTQSEMVWNDVTLLLPLFILINQCINSVISEHCVLWVVLVLSACDLAYYCSGVCKQIAAHLHISVFTLQRPKTCVD